MKFNTASAMAFLLYSVTAYPSPLSTSASLQCPSIPPDPHGCNESQGLGYTGPESDKWIGNGFTLQYVDIGADLASNCHNMRNFRGEAGKCYDVNGIWYTCREAKGYTFDGSANCNVWATPGCGRNGTSPTHLEKTSEQTWGFDSSHKSAMRVLSYKCT
ncbi:hypothetical protein DIS24_g10067 [Lasiodiplodia hormozganensis]|uniref:Secreted protein n=1 Tax=Lasiodiplodia hormozganensis TaxID=869390 RepID=A0AA39XQ62_9PEZI|nr:hypothetical protein DIS24_g10067 [Lasiodiplodia hormozganensis]